jgi:hypothetical protein
MPNARSLAVVAAFFVLTGVAPHGTSVELRYPLAGLHLDLSLQYIGLPIALGLVLRWRWARLAGLFATLALLVVLVVELLFTAIGPLSGRGSFQFALLWPWLAGTSLIAFAATAVAISCYLYWQAKTLASSETRALFQGTS